MVGLGIGEAGGPLIVVLCRKCIEGYREVDATLPSTMDR
jgi:hypothetical protein